MTDDISLRQHMETLLESHKELHEAHDKSHEREHTDQAKALEKAETGNREWRAASNEWREAMKDREAKFVSEAEHAALEKKVEDLERANIRREEADKTRLAAEAEEKRQDERRQSSQRWQVGIVVAAVSIAVSLVLRFLPSGP